MALWAHCVLRHCIMCICIRYAMVQSSKVPVICDLCKPFFNRLHTIHPNPANPLRTRIPGKHDVCSACSLKIDVIYIIGRQALVRDTLCYACAKFLLENFF